MTLVKLLYQHTFEYYFSKIFMTYFKTIFKYNLAHLLKK